MMMMTSRGLNRASTSVIIRALIEINALDRVYAVVKKLIGNLLVVNRHRRYTAVDVLCDPFVLTVGGSVSLDDRLDELRRSRRAELERRTKQNRLGFRHGVTAPHG